MARIMVFALSLSSLVLAGCAGSPASDRACRVFSPPPVSAASPNGQNQERVNVQATGDPTTANAGRGC